MGRRVAITGIGVVAPGGIGVEPFWDLLTAGRTATRTISFFDPTPFRSRVAAEADFDPARHGFDAREAVELDRSAQFAVVAAREALAHSGIAPTDPDDRAHRWGVTVGSAVGATMGLDREYAVVSEGGSRWLVDHTRAPARLFDYFVPSSISAEVAGRFGVEGPVAMLSAGCTSGLDAVGHAAALIAEGSADVMLAGATDAPISPITVACFDAIKATTARNDDPATASRPFDGTRDGFVLGEGAAMFVLEELDAARARGATIVAELAAHASRCNAFHMTGLRADGREMSVAIDAALADAKLDPERVDHVNAHGSGTVQNDRHETAAVKRSLGEHARRTPMSSIKSMIGHSLGAIGSLELAACALAVDRGVVPPTANYAVPDPQCDLDYVPREARPADLDVVLSVGSGFGGFQSAVVVTREGVLG
ncbi:beta-ketoacyl-[acyl-carrier-protein] synthase family protein [Actinomycetospora termitidis]|uniref:Beta-ketoacyl-[acyl-carrier-protein] synthase family protein n=1 Tax=Actinomycetospora termitidis TaxID=3053470 RepID=A0ABT7MD60_9PSEU|nr:beta-ketoacyl-[acyl-carrier-protein] synthase family protein [Actinomycetospora sp. Odt1-22]MDL5158583.1 beta-ketoacyl-[acyl-carrier-protein] synthase family protein [Actinomycetospora sp. Odt1-22]